MNDSEQREDEALSAALTVAWIIMLAWVVGALMAWVTV